MAKERLLTAKEAALHLTERTDVRVSTSMLGVWRYANRGPAHRRVDGWWVRYTVKDLNAFARQWTRRIGNCI